MMNKLETISDLKKLLDSKDSIKLYGAGYYLSLFLENIEKMDPMYLKKIGFIMVADTKGNPKMVRGIPVCPVSDAALEAGDYVLLTLGQRFADEVYGLLKDTKTHIFQMDFNMFQEEAYLNVKRSIQPFIDGFLERLDTDGQTETNKEIRAWSCWWQGQAQAPELVKSCWKSQKRNLPPGIEHIIITEENYREYVVLPESIMKKVDTGDISYTHLSDIIRVNLLYKYGGFWMDAAVYVLKPLEKSILEYPIYTRNLPETQFCSNAMWTIGFLYAKPGNILFRFLSESFSYYFSVYDKLEYYFTLDYMIAIACNLFPDIEEQFQQIPYNNEKAFCLKGHLTEPFDAEKYRCYTENTSIQMLTYKLDLTEVHKEENTIYKYISC